MPTADELSLTLRLGALETEVQAIKLLLGEGGEIPTIPQQFVDLTDTPADYTGAAGKVLRVNDDGDAVIFGTVDASGIAEAPEDGQGYLRKNAAWTPFAFEATATMFTIQATTPPNINSGWSQRLWQFDTPSRTEGSSTSGIKYALSTTYGPYGAEALYTGQPAFTDHVLGLGWNMSSAYTPINENHGAPTYRIESKFPKASRRPGYLYMFGSEQHLAQHTIGESGQEWRSISIWQPFENEHWAYDSDISFISSFYSFADGNYVGGNSNPIITFDFTGAHDAAKNVQLKSTVKIQHNGNNTPIFSQQNAAGNGQLNLPYVDNTNNYTFQCPIYMSAGSVLTNPLGIKSLASFVGASGFDSGSRLVYVNANSITGNAIGFQVEQNASTYLTGLSVINTHASGKAGARIQSDGNSYLEFYNITAFHRWGIRTKPATGKFTIGKSEFGEDAGGDAIEIDYTTLRVKFLKDPIIPAGTLASAGAAPEAGAIRFVTDLNATTVGSVAAGGGTNDGVIISDGSAWRILSAW